MINSPEDALKLENQLCFRLYSISRNITRLYTPILQEFGLTYPQYIIMLVLFEESTLDFKKLSQRVELKTGTLTPIVQKLEEMGFVKKEKNPNDARRLDVSLTETGYALKTAVLKVPYRLAEQIGLHEDQYSALINQLDQLSHTLQKSNQSKE